MIDPNQIRQVNQDLCLLAGEKFFVKTDSLEKAMRKIGRRLPKWAHKQADVLVKAEAMSGHPKLSMMLDVGEIKAAETKLRTAFDAIDPKDRRKGAVLSVLGSLSLSLFVVIGLVVLVLWWRGFL